MILMTMEVNSFLDSGLKLQRYLVGKSYFYNAQNNYYSNIEFFKFDLIYFNQREQVCNETFDKINFTLLENNQSPTC